MAKDKIRKWGMNVGLCVISTGLGLLLGEVGLRLFWPQNLSLSYQTRDGLKILRPNHQGVYRGVETVQPYQTNSFGMRDREHQVEKPKGSYRVLVLGDSFMEALQVRFEQAFPSVLEGKLNQVSLQQVEVINAAVSGWGTDDQLTYLSRYAIRFQPDLILVGMTLTNDVSDNLAERFHHLTNHELIERPAREFSFAEYKFWQAKAALGSYSHLYQLIRLGWHSREIEVGGEQLEAHVVDQLSKEPSERLKEGWRLTFELFKKIRTTGEMIGAEVVVFLIPISAQLGEEGLGEFAQTHHLSQVAPYGPQEAMKAFGQTEQIQIIDLLPCFRECQGEGRRLILKRDGHWTEEGHEVAASLVWQTLIANPPPKLRHMLDGAKATTAVSHCTPGCCLNAGESH